MLQRCRRRQQRLLLSLASSLLASFAGMKYTNLMRVRVRTPRKSHGCYILVLLAKTSPLPFIATRELAEGEPVTQQYMDTFMAVFMAAFTDAVKDVIMQILQIVTSLVSTE